MGHRLGPVAQVVGQDVAPVGAEEPADLLERPAERRVGVVDGGVHEPLLDALEQHLELGAAQQLGLGVALDRLVAHGEQEPEAAVVHESADPQVEVVPGQVGEADPGREADDGVIAGVEADGDDGLLQPFTVVGVHQLDEGLADDLGLAEPGDAMQGERGEPAP